LEVEPLVLLFVLESIFVLLDELGALELELGAELEVGAELALGVALEVVALVPEPSVALVFGALEPPAALASLPDFDLCFEVEPLEDCLFFLFLRSPLCLPLSLCWPLSMLVESDVVAPAPAFAPVDVLPLVPLLVLVPAPLPTLAFALPLALVSPCALVLWAAASWLNDTASKPEKRTGKNLRIENPPGLGNGMHAIVLQRPCHAGFHFGGSTGSSRGNFCGLGEVWRRCGPALALTARRFSSGTGAVPPAAPSARRRSCNSFCCCGVSWGWASGFRCSCADAAVERASRPAINSVRMAISLRTVLQPSYR